MKHFSAAWPFWLSPHLRHPQHTDTGDQNLPLWNVFPFLLGSKDRFESCVSSSAFMQQKSRPPVLPYKSPRIMSDSSYLRNIAKRRQQQQRRWQRQQRKQPWPVMFCMQSNSKSFSLQCFRVWFQVLRHHSIVYQSLSGIDEQHLSEDCLHERQQHKWKHGNILGRKGDISRS